MRVLRIIVQIAILYIYYYLGVLIVDSLGLPFPGSIIGLLLLSISLHLKWVKVEYIRDGAGFLIGILTLFFIPTTVGVIEYPELWTINGLLVMVAVTISTIFSIYITGVFSQMIEKKEQSIKQSKQKEGETCD